MKIRSLKNVVFYNMSDSKLIEAVFQRSGKKSIKKAIKAGSAVALKGFTTNYDLAFFAVIYRKEILSFIGLNTDEFITAYAKHYGHNIVNNEQILMRSYFEAKTEELVCKDHILSYISLSVLDKIVQLFIY